MVTARVRTERDEPRSLEDAGLLEKGRQSSTLPHRPVSGPAGHAVNVELERLVRPRHVVVEPENERALNLTMNGDIPDRWVVEVGRRCTLTNHGESFSLDLARRQRDHLPEMPVIRALYLHVGGDRENLVGSFFGDRRQGQRQLEPMHVALDVLEGAFHELGQLAGDGEANADGPRLGR